MIFAKEKVNTGRQTEIDLARGFTAILIILCHVGLYLGDGSNRAIYTFSDIIGSEPCAPVFMTLMGASVAFSRHQNPKAMLLRGITLFFGGYLLSAYRTLLARLIFGSIDEWTSLASFFVVDILQLAGLTFMLFALLKRLKIPNIVICALSLVMVFVNQLFIANPPHITNEYAIYFVNLFIPLSEWSCFPFLTWFFFPAFGLVFGEALLHCNNKKLFYGILCPVSLAGAVYVYSRFYCLYPDYAENYYFGGNFYYMGVKNVLLTALCVIFFISFWFFAGEALPQFVKRFLTFLSRNLTVFYVFSWIVISALLHIGAKFSINYGAAVIIALMVAVTALCCVATHFYLSVKKKIKSR